MESAVIVTYRCNSRCCMCHTWKHPSRVSEEFSPDILVSLPHGQSKINITGGEPTLREDLPQIVEILRPKTSRLEISTNGSRPEQLFRIAEKHPEMTFRISLDGMPQTNEKVRGITGGYELAMQSVEGLRKRGVRDVGLAMTISDMNIQDLVPLYELAADKGLEFTQCVPHNSHYFHKHDNVIENKKNWEEGVEQFIVSLLTSKRRSIKLRVKDWFRAYMNLGLLQHVQGHSRPLECRAGTDFFFVDPYGDILPCNGMQEKDSLGNLNDHPFDDIWASEKAQEVRQRVRSCDRGCWMVGSAVPAIRRNMPKVAFWVLRNKLRLFLGKETAL